MVGISRAVRSGALSHMTVGTVQKTGVYTAFAEVSLEFGMGRLGDLCAGKTMSGLCDIVFDVEIEDVFGIHVIETGVSELGFIGRFEEVVLAVTLSA